jgi:hypothetical protein
MIRVHIADGSKGGVGKSQSAHVLINYLSRNDKSIIVFETDTQIPDVARCIKNTDRKIRLELADIRDDDGWQSMLETIPDIALDPANNKAISDIVLSLPGADLDIKHYTDLVKILSDALNIQIWDWFVLNAQADSVSLLRESIDSGFASISTKKIAVKNGFFGKADNFVAFDSSKLSSKLDHVIYLPALSTDSARKLRTESIVIDEVIEKAKMGLDGGRPDFLYSSNLLKWVSTVDKELDKVFNSGVN